MKQHCARAEMLAGAIALDEATDAERDEYRRHVAACAPCLGALGGEREIERVMRTVADAHASETWEPIVPSTSERRSRAVRSVWRFGLSTAAMAVIVSLAAHFIVAATVRPVTLAQEMPLQQVAANVMHVTLEHRPATPVQKAAPRSIAPSLVVVHNVITLKAPERLDTKSAPKASVPAAEARISTTTVVAAATAPPSNVPIWRRDGAFPSARATQAPLMQGRAESIAVAPSYIVRDVSPLGGDSAIEPRPPLIAYSQGAEGTTAFEVSVDDRGAPQRCTITKSSGYLSLDNAVCAAAMRARYAPRTVNGRATAGIYRDAFTFRAQMQETETTPIPQVM